MTYQEIINKIRPDLEKTLEYLRNELAKIRTSRASPSLVEDIEVDYFGAKLSLKQLATISSRANQIIVQPWDRNSIESVAKSIFLSGLGLNPIVEGQIIKIILPPMSEERRKEYLKLVGEKVEEARISIRRQREEAWREIQDLAGSGQMREDDKFRGKDELQELVDEYNGKIEELAKNKEKEMMTL